MFAMWHSIDVHSGAHEFGNQERRRTGDTERAQRCEPFCRVPSFDCISSGAFLASESLWLVHAVVEVEFRLSPINRTNGGGDYVQAAFLAAVVGTTSVLAVAASQLPGVIHRPIYFVSIP